MNSIILLIAALGLSVVTLIFLSRYNFKIAVALLIPLSYAVYYAAVVQVPKVFGYAVPLNFTDLDQSKFLFGLNNGDTIIILLREKGAAQPRLISIPSSESNKKALEEIQKQAKKGAAILRKKGNESPKEGAGKAIGPRTESDIEPVPMAEQEIMKKDD